MSSWRPCSACSQVSDTACLHRHKVLLSPAVGEKGIWVPKSPGCALSKVVWWRGKPLCVHSAQRQDSLSANVSRPGAVSWPPGARLRAAGVVVGLVQDARCGQGQGSPREERGMQAGPQPLETSAAQAHRLPLPW